MLSVREARSRILSFFLAVESTTVPLAESCGRVLSEDIAAETDLPPFDNSSVDGFAVRSADVTTASIASPLFLSVIADIPAGVLPEVELRSEQAARIMTGAAIPAGADAVVMVEDTDFVNLAPGSPAPQAIEIRKAALRGENIRTRASDVTAGQVVIPSGTRLRAQDLGLLAMLGVANVPVRRRVRVALLSSGDELLPVNAPLAPGKVRDSNSYSLAALAEGPGVELLRLGVAPDSGEAVRGLLDQAVSARADVIISSAGVSVGAFDYVKSIVEENGSLDFWKVDMRPGKPLAFGNYREIPFFGLPGNPVSAFVGFIVFVQPALDKLCGLPARSRPVTRVRLGEALESDGRESYLRAIVEFNNGAPVARLTGHQGSGNLLSLVQANALLIVPSGVKYAPPGAEVDAWLL